MIVAGRQLSWFKSHTGENPEMFEDAVGGGIGDGSIGGVLRGHILAAAMGVIDPVMKIDGDVLDTKVRQPGAGGGIDIKRTELGCLGTGPTDGKIEILGNVALGERISKR